MGKIIDGKAMANELLEQLAREMRRKKLRPFLASILVGNNPDSVTYVRVKARTCARIGIENKVWHLPERTSEKTLLRLIKKLNADEKVNGILVQLPLPRQIDQGKVLRAIDPRKDIDGLHPINIGKTAAGDETFPACTPSGVIYMLEKSGVRIAGKHVVIIGRSLNVGRPLALLLLNRDATVTVCHSKTRNLASHTRQADILIVAAGKPGLVKAGMVKRGAVVIDVGLTRIGDRMLGDVDFERVRRKASLISPVPGGVGPMTVAMLMQNTVRAAELQG